MSTYLQAEPAARTGATTDSCTGPAARSHAGQQLYLTFVELILFLCEKVIMESVDPEIQVATILQEITTKFSKFDNIAEYNSLLVPHLR